MCRDAAQTIAGIKASFHLSLAGFFTLNGLIRSLLAQAASVQVHGPSQTNIFA